MQDLVKKNSQEIPKILPEEQALFIISDKIAVRHRELYQQTKQEVNILFDRYKKTSDLNIFLDNLSDSDFIEFNKKLKLLKLLKEEELSIEKSPFSTFAMFQILKEEDDIKKILEEITKIRTEVKDKIELKQKLEHKQFELNKKLQEKYQQIEKDILDLESREYFRRNMEIAFAKRGLVSKKNIVTAGHIAEVSEGTEYLALFVRSCLGMIHHLHSVDIAKNDIPIVSAVIGMVTTLAMIACAHPDKMDTHEKTNLVVMTVAGLLGSVKSGLTAATAVSESLAHSFSFLPFAGLALLLVYTGLAISNIVKIRKDHDYTKNKLHELFLNSNDDWLQEGEKLSKRAEELKSTLLENISIDEIIKNPEAVRSLFTKKEFEQKVIPKLYKYLEDESVKKIANQAFGLSVYFAIGVLSVVSIAIPAVGVAMGIAITSFLVASFFARLILNKTILKATDTKNISDVSASIDSLTKAVSYTVDQNKPVALEQSEPMAVQSSIDSHGRHTLH